MLPKARPSDQKGANLSEYKRTSRIRRAAKPHGIEVPNKLNRMQQWIIRLYGRVGYHKTLVAIANKHARQLWAMPAKGETYGPEDAWQQYAIGDAS